MHQCSLRFRVLSEDGALCGAARCRLRHTPRRGRLNAVRVRRRVHLPSRLGRPGPCVMAVRQAGQKAFDKAILDASLRSGATTAPTGSTTSSCSPSPSRADPHGREGRRNSARKRRGDLFRPAPRRRNVAASICSSSAASGRNSQPSMWSASPAGTSAGPSALAVRLTRE